MNEILYIIGQALGMIAIVLGVLSYQMKTRKGLVAVQLLTTITFVIHYSLIGAWSGMALNAVSTVRNIIFLWVERKGGSSKKWGYIFAVIMGIVGIISWQDWYSVFMVMALVINCIGMGFTNPQSTRKSILITSPMALIYNCFVLSVGGAIFETMSIISAALGIWRNRGKKNA